MAKVRIQARTSEHDTDQDGLPHASRSPANTKQTGAVGLLIRVLKTEGFVGWYQVTCLDVRETNLVCLLKPSFLTLVSTGDVGTDRQSGALTSAVVRLQGAV